MTILPNDKATYTVTYIDQVKGFQSIKTETFAQAAGIADALTGITRFINATITNGTSSWSGSLYKYSKLNNQRTSCNQTLIKSCAKLEQSRYETEKAV